MNTQELNQASLKAKAEEDTAKSHWIEIEKAIVSGLGKCEEG